MRTFLSVSKTSAAREAVTRAASSAAAKNQWCFPRGLRRRPARGAPATRVREGNQAVSIVRSRRSIQLPDFLASFGLTQQALRDPRASLPPRAPRSRGALPRGLQKRRGTTQTRMSPEPSEASVQAIEGRIASKECQPLDTVELGFAIRPVVPDSPAAGASESETPGASDDESADDDDVGLQTRRETSCWTDWDGGIAGGPDGIYLAPLTPEMEQALICPGCSKRRSFLLQIYAPLDDAPAAFHRDLLVYICTQVDCPIASAKDGTSERAVCLRAQLPRKNEYYAYSVDELALARVPPPDRAAWGAALEGGAYNPVGIVVGTGSDEKEEDEDDDEDEDDENAHGEIEKEVLDKTCPICAKPSSLKCSACKSVFYCGAEHQLEHWRRAEDGHKAKCAELQDARMKQSDLDEIMHSAFLPDRKKSKKDPVYESFLKRVQKYPAQVIRYGRWGSAFAPIWVASQGRPTSGFTCDKCGCERKLEIQVLPQLLHFIENTTKNVPSAETAKVLGDFGTVAVYTCPASCSETVWSVESAWCQPMFED